MFYILSVANREKLQPQRKITKQCYSPKERKERAGSGTELVAGLGAGMAVLTPQHLHAQPWWLTGTCSPHQPHGAVHLFHYPKRRDALNIHGHAHTWLVLLPFFACKLSGMDVQTVATGTRASPEKAVGSPLRADSPDPHGAAAHLKTSRSILSRKQGDSVKCHIFCSTEG